MHLNFLLNNYCSERTSLLSNRRNTDVVIYSSKQIFEPIFFENQLNCIASKQGFWPFYVLRRVWAWKSNDAGEGWPPSSGRSAWVIPWHKTPATSNTIQLDYHSKLSRAKEIVYILLILLELYMYSIELCMYS